MMRIRDYTAGGMDSSWWCHKCRVPLVRQGGGLRCAGCGFQVWERNGYDDAGMPVVAGYTVERTRVLADLETGHFWFGPRDRLIRRICSAIDPGGGRVLELGCGTGRFMAGFGARPGSYVGVDAFENSIQVAVSRQSGGILLRGDVCAVPLEDGCFDLVVSMDVLEHVDPDAFLSEAHRLVRPGGRMVLSVPAGPRLWSEADKVAGHRCRYTLRMIKAELDRQGWRLLGSTHYQFLLYPLMVLSRMLLRGRSRVERHPPVFMNRILGWINALEVNLFAGRALPWGSSLIVWAERT